MSFNYLIAALSLLFLITSNTILAQSFWKKYGSPTHPLAQHSDVLYLSKESGILVSTFNMGVFKSKDEGSSWEHVLKLPKDQPIFNLYTTSKGAIMAGGYNKIYIGDEKGDKWQEVSLNYGDVSKIAEDEKGNLYLSSTHPVGVLKSADGGLSWKPFNRGLTNLYVDDLVSDRKGNLFCSAVDTNSVGQGGLFYLNTLTNKWEKKEVKIKLGETLYQLRIDGINAMAISNSNELYLSFTGVITNFSVSGIFKNSLEGTITESVWQQDLMNEASSTPISLVVEDLYFTQTGNIFASRNSSVSIGVYSKLSYTKKWTECIEGVQPAILVLSRFSERPDGSLLLGVQYFNQLFITQESKDGKKVQQITFNPLQTIKLYEKATLQAQSSSGIDVKFKSMDQSRAYIEEKKLTAVGLGRVSIKAYLEGNDSLYYAEQMQSLIITKAGNVISIDSLSARVEEGDSTGIYARASSGLCVELTVVKGDAIIEKDTLTPPQSPQLLLAQEAGRVQVAGTEPGNETYAAADTVRINFCVYPTQPVLTMMKDSLTGKVTLMSSIGKGYQWYFNGIQMTNQGQSLQVQEPGEYRVRTYADDCVSLPSEVVKVTITGVEDDSFKQSLKVYPLPFNQGLIIQKPTNFLQQTFRCTLIDLFGRIIDLPAAENEERIQLHTEMIPPGVYLLKIESGHRMAIWKVVKNN